MNGACPEFRAVYIHMCFSVSCTVLVKQPHLLSTKLVNVILVVTYVVIDYKLPLWKLLFCFGTNAFQCLCCLHIYNDINYYINHTEHDTKFSFHLGMLSVRKDLQTEFFPELLMYEFSVYGWGPAKGFCGYKRLHMVHMNSCTTGNHSENLYAIFCCLIMY